MSVDFQRSVLAECPHCSFRFGDPDEPLQEGDELICPECRGFFYVLSLHPPEFDYVSACDAPVSLFTHNLVAEGMTGDSPWLEDVTNIVLRARKQGLRGITLRVDFEKGEEDGLRIEILSVD